MFRRVALYQKKDRKKLILYKSLVIVMIIGAALLAAHINNLSLPTVEEKISWSLGVILIVIVATLAIFNRIKLLFKVKSLGFIFAVVALSLLRVGIDTLISSLWLISIPLLIDDLIIESYFKYLDIKKYGLWERRE